MKRGLLLFFVLFLGGGYLVSAQTSLDTTIVLNTSKSVVVVSPVNYKKSTYPSPQRAAIYSAILPGAGQIYNRKYWKLPIIYGGIGACIYAITWNNRMYHDYYNAYRDYTVKDADGNPIGTSYIAFIPAGDSTVVDPVWFTSSLKQKKDYYKKYRNLSIIILTGVYVMNILDANVDAQFFNFDISRNLSLKVDPILIDTPENPSGIYGLKLSITF